MQHLAGLHEDGAHKIESSLFMQEVKSCLLTSSTRKANKPANIKRGNQVPLSKQKAPKLLGLDPGFQASRTISNWLLRYFVFSCRVVPSWNLNSISATISSSLAVQMKRTYPLNQGISCVSVLLVACNVVIYDNIKLYKMMNLSDLFLRIRLSLPRKTLIVKYWI